MEPFETSYVLPFHSIEDYGEKKDKLGEGTFGTVYKYTKGDESVAVKVVDTTEPGRILGEIGYMLRLRHPNVLNIIDVVVTTVQTDVVLPLASKGTFRDIPPEVSFETRKSYACQFLKGVDYFLSRQIVHGDIKPANVLVFEDGTVKVSDFGLAKAYTCEGSYEATENIYTPVYRSPEVFLGGSYSEASDIWAAGCTVYEIFNPKFPLFDPGTDRVIEYIMSFYKDPEVLWPKIKELPNYEHLSKSKGYVFKEPLVDKLKQVISDPELIKILSSMLQPNPSLRSQLFSVIENPFFDGVRGEYTHSSFTCEEAIDLRSTYPPIGKTEKILWQRRLLFDWLIDVNRNFHLNPRTLCLAYYIADSYTGVTSIDVKDQYQLIGCAALCIASVYWELYPLDARDLLFISKNAFTKERFVGKVVDVVKTLKYDFLITTAADYMELFIKAYPTKIKETAQSLLSLAYIGKIPFHHSGKQIALVCLLLACTYHGIQFKHTSKLGPEAKTLYDEIFNEAKSEEGKAKMSSAFIVKIRTAPIKVL